jgi:hypothetical protein
MSILVRTLNVQPCGCSDCGITALKAKASGKNQSFFNGNYLSENQQVFSK